MSSTNENKQNEINTDISIDSKNVQNNEQVNTNTKKFLENQLDYLTAEYDELFDRMNKRRQLLKEQTNQTDQTEK
jgi:hypothetical protein